MLVIARAQLAMKIHMDAQRRRANSQALSDGLLRLRVKEVSNTPQMKLVPVSAIDNLPHSGNSPMGRSSWLFKVKAAPILVETGTEQCQVQLAINFHVKTSPKAPWLAFWAVPEAFGL